MVHIDSKDRWLLRHCQHFDVGIVTRLDLSNKNLKSLPDLIKSFKSLEFLDCSNNNLTDRDVAKLANLPLETLILKNNPLISNLNSISPNNSVSSLVNLDCSFTSLMTLPTNLLAIENLVIEQTPALSSMERMLQNGRNMIFPKLAFFNHLPVQNITTGEYNGSFYQIANSQTSPRKIKSENNPEQKDNNFENFHFNTVKLDDRINTAKSELLHNLSALTSL